MLRIKNEYEQTVLDYVGYKAAEGLKPSYTNDLRGRLFYVGRQCGFVDVKEMTKERLLQWFLGLSEIDVETGKASRSPASRSLYRKALYPFLEWCLMMGSFKGENPADKLPRPKAKGDIRRRRRALSEAELLTLFRVARLKPMAEYARRRECRLSNNATGWEDCKVTLDNLDEYAAEAEKLLNKNPKYLAQLKREGVHRELVYRTLALTGLRRNEIRTLKASQIVFDGQPRIEMDPFFEKNSDGSTIYLPIDLANDIKDWIEDRKIQPTDLVFTVSKQAVKTLHRDCEVAGIERKDARGRSVDIHALRTSYCMLLQTSGASPRVAMSAMRHSKLELTMNVYTDTAQLLVAEAVNVLPTFGRGPLMEATQANPEPPKTIEPQPKPAEQTAGLLSGDMSNKLLAALMKSCDAETLKSALLASM